MLICVVDIGKNGRLEQSGNPELLAISRVGKKRVGKKAGGCFARGEDIFNFFCLWRTTPEKKMRPTFFSLSLSKLWPFLSGARNGGPTLVKKHTNKEKEI